ncbi:MAG TPA: hypothetical protein VLB84_09090 [Bacteroidia bacterium]|nr:hypothetical protein [Bacteroidia bacterium]
MNFPNRRTIHLFFTGLLVVAICSCKMSTKSKLAEYDPALEKIVRVENGAFRGFNLGDPLDSVKLREPEQPIEADQGYLYYEYKVDDTTGSYSISYNFDEKGLNEIQSDIFITNTINTDRIFNAFKSYFDDHYGGSELDMGYNVWTVKSQNYGDVKINLSDESTSLTTDHAPGKISIWIYPDKN